MGESTGREEDAPLAEHVKAAWFCGQKSISYQAEEQAAQLTAGWGRLRWMRGMLNMDTAAAGKLVMASSSLSQRCQGLVLFPAERRVRYADNMARFAPDRSSNVRVRVSVSADVGVGGVCFGVSIDKSGYPS